MSNMASWTRTAPPIAALVMDNITLKSWCSRNRISRKKLSDCTVFNYQQGYTNFSLVYQGTEVLQITFHKYRTMVSETYHTSLLKV